MQRTGHRIRLPTEMVIHEETDMCARLLSVLMAMMVLAGCNTIQGAGTDIERGGEKIQDAAGKARK